VGIGTWVKASLSAGAYLNVPWSKVMAWVVVDVSPV